MADEMRTITLDEDVAAKVADATQRTGTTAHEIVNATLRRTLPAPVVQPKPFKVRPRRMGTTGLNLDCTERLLNEVEGPNSTPSEPFQITGPFVRSRPGYSFDNIEKLLDEVESPTRR